MREKVGSWGDAYGLRPHASHRAMLRRLGLTVSVAIAVGGCRPLSAQEVESRRIQRELDYAYDRCIGRNVGMFGSASMEVIRECQRQAKAAVRGVAR